MLRPGGLVGRRILSLPGSLRRPPEIFPFDFRGTLVDVDSGDPASWVMAALDRLELHGTPIALGSDRVTGLSQHLHRIWEHAATFDPNSDRDLSGARHREVFAQAVTLYPDVPPAPVHGLGAVLRLVGQA